MEDQISFLFDEALVQDSGTAQKPAVNHVVYPL
jgi:hypothetical protein